jgi:hypothetical protein
LPPLILFDPPLERFAAVHKIVARQFTFLLQQAAFQRLFTAPPGHPARNG